jgi:hypothetical protein
METKNKCNKERNKDKPYEIWKSPDGSWEWRVLKKWQSDDNKPYARWFCAVKSPFTFGSFDIGDVYVKDIKENAIKVWSEEDGEVNTDYKTKCVFCNREFVTTRNTANEGVCIQCRECKIENEN